MSVWAVIVAAGTSERFGGVVPKQYVEVLGRPLLAWTLSRFEECSAVDSIVLVVAAADLDRTAPALVDRWECAKVRKIVPGGATRRESVKAGVAAVPQSAELIAVHDGARPAVSPADIAATIEAARTRGAAVLAVPVTDTLKRARDGIITGTQDRRDLYHAQTPQVFRADLLRRAHEEVPADFAATDDAALLEKLGEPVQVVTAAAPNPKVTTPSDLIWVTALLEAEVHA